MNIWVRKHIGRKLEQYALEHLFDPVDELQNDLKNLFPDHKVQVIRRSHPWAIGNEIVELWVGEAAVQIGREIARP